MTRDWVRGGHGWMNSKEDHARYLLLQGALFLCKNIFSGCTVRIPLRCIASMCMHSFALQT